jgi:hypothetical protein
MPKPIHKISEYNLSYLKSKLEEKLTFRILTKLDCKKASEAIQHERDKSISESTIYRLFLLEGNKNTPYQHTLDILAQFIGHSDWFSFENYLDYHLKITLSELLNKKRKVTENEFGEEAEAPGKVNLFLSIKGPANNLKFVYDKKAVRAKIAADLKKEGATIKEIIKSNKFENLV